MQKKALAGCVLLFGCLGFSTQAARAAQPAGAAKRSLTVFLYAGIPDPGGDGFKALTARVKAEFEKEHPQVDLTVTMDPNTNIYDCATLQKLYAAGGPQVLEIDTVTLGYLEKQKFLVKPKLIASEYAGAAVKASRVGSEIWAVPTSYGGNLFLVGRNKEILEAKTAPGLLAILAKLDDGKRPKLVGNLLGSWVTPITYISAYFDTKGAGAPGFFNMPPDPIVMNGKDGKSGMNGVLNACTFQGANNCVNGTYSSNQTQPAIDFAQQKALTFTGYPESMFDIENNGGTGPFYIIDTPMGDKTNVISSWVNAATISAASCKGQCIKDAAAFIHYYNRDSTKAWIALSQDVPGKPPRYLISAKKSFIKVPEINKNPNFHRFGEILAKAYPVPNQGVPAERIKMFKPVCEDMKKKIPDANCSKTPTWCPQ